MARAGADGRPVTADVLIVGGRVLDPGTGRDEQADVAIAGGRITAVVPRDAQDTAVAARRTIDATGMLVLPGLVDFHVHVFDGVSHYGVDADTYCLQRGVTHGVDAGSAGAQTFAGFKRYVMDRAMTGLHAFLNISTTGMLVPEAGELEDPRFLAADKALAVATAHPDDIVGIKLRVGERNAGHPDVGFGLEIAKQVATDAAIPLMVHITNTRLPLSDILATLGAGDVVTHCFHGRRGGILDHHGRVEGFVRDAIDRGVLLDVGHGRGAMSYRVARAGLAQAVVPDHVSSDIHAYNADGPVYDLATTMSKMLHVGMSLEEVVAAVTVRPATAMRRDHVLGALRAGREADVSIVELLEGRWMLEDSEGEVEQLDHLFVPRWVVRRGNPMALATSVHER